MKDWRSQAHVKWDCKYHVVVVPKYRNKKVFERVRSELGGIFRQLCRQKGVELEEGKAARDHVHMLLSVPPKYSIAMMIGYGPFGKKCNTAIQNNPLYSSVSADVDVPFFMGRAIPEGKECNPGSSRTAQDAGNFVWTSVLVTRILREHRGLG